MASNSWQEPALQDLQEATTKTGLKAIAYKHKKIGGFYSWQKYIMTTQ
jgi:hypothetical protein